LLSEGLYLSLSGPCRVITKFNFPNPPIGALSLPVLKNNSLRCCSGVKEWTTDQKFLCKQYKA